MTSAPSIGFEYRPSRWPARLLLAMGVLAIVASWLSALPAWLAATLTMTLATGIVWLVRRGRNDPVRRATWRADGSWQLQLHDDSDVEATLVDARVGAGAIVLHLRWPPRRRASLLLFADNLDADTRRRLRMRLSAGADID